MWRALPSGAGGWGPVGNTAIRSLPVAVKAEEKEEEKKEKKEKELNEMPSNPHLTGGEKRLWEHYRQFLVHSGSLNLSIHLSVFIIFNNLFNLCSVFWNFALHQQFCSWFGLCFGPLLSFLERSHSSTWTSTSRHKQHHISYLEKKITAAIQCLARSRKAAVSKYTW